MTTWPTASSPGTAGSSTWPGVSAIPSPVRSAMLARISAVQHRIGAPGLTLESPVIMPTFSGPKAATRSKNFSLTRALIGAV